MTSPEPTASVAALSAWGMAITLFLLAAQTVRRARSNATRCRMLATKFVAVNEGVMAGKVCRRSARRRVARLVRPAERRLHLAAHLHGERGFGPVDVAPAQALAPPHAPPEPDPIGGPQPPQPPPQPAR